MHGSLLCILYSQSTVNWKFTIMLFSHCHVFCDLPAWITDSIYIGRVHFALINLQGLFMAFIIFYLEWPFPCPHHENMSLGVPVYLFDYLHLTVRSLRDLRGETHEKVLHIFSPPTIVYKFPSTTAGCTILSLLIWSCTGTLYIHIYTWFCFSAFVLFFLYGARSARFNFCGLVVHLFSMAV